MGRYVNLSEEDKAVLVDAFRRNHEHHMKITITPCSHVVSIDRTFSFYDLFPTIFDVNADFPRNK